MSVIQGYIGETIGTFRIVRYIVGVSHLGVSVGFHCTRIRQRYTDFALL